MKPQCNARNGTCRCIRPKHFPGTVHQSYGKSDFLWYTWDRTKRIPTLAQLIRIQNKDHCE